MRQGVARGLGNGFSSKRHPSPKSLFALDCVPYLSRFCQLCTARLGTAEYVQRALGLHCFSQTNDSAQIRFDQRSTSMAKQYLGSGPVTSETDPKPWFALPPPTNSLA